MNNFILINQTFAETTPESLEDGDFSKTGFIEQDKQVTFRELVRLMKDHPEASQSGKDINTNVWFSSYFETVCYRTGTERETSIHFSRNNSPNAAKYWKLAAIAARKK